METVIEDKWTAKLLELQAEIGQTPLIDVSALSRNPNVKIWAKKEWEQLGGSVKARAAFFIISHALKSGELNEDKVLLDASSGNTAIAYAAILKRLGLKLTIVLPENASEERKVILKDLGANLIFSSPFEGTDGAQELAKILYKEQPSVYCYADQYNNSNNWRSHYHTTAEEIFTQSNGRITHFAASLGTTGTFVGTSKRLKEIKPTVECVQFQPNAPMHGLEGWKHLETAKVPGIFEPEIACCSRFIDSAEAIEFIPEIIQKTGLKVSPSAAASLLGAVQLSEEINTGTIVTVLADNYEKYGEVYKRLNLKMNE